MNRVWCTAFLASALNVACGGGDSRETTPAVASEPPPAAAAAVPTAPEAESMGTLAFTVDGRPRNFDHLPADHNNYTPVASTIRAMPAAGRREQVAITFMSIDLRKQQYPAELPLPKGSGSGGNPLAAMANVGFSYTDEDGREWAAPGRIRIASFGTDGVVEGTFANVSLPHTEKTLPNVTLADGSFRVRISAPW